MSGMIESTMTRGRIILVPKSLEEPLARMYPSAMCPTANEAVASYFGNLEFRRINKDFSFQWESNSNQEIKILVAEQLSIAPRMQP